MLPSFRFRVIFNLLLVGFLCFTTSNFSLGCIGRERQALLEFKQGLKDPNYRLSSWVGEDCCKWKGIHCKNKTGHIVKLNLRNSNQEPSSEKRRAQHAVTGDFDAYLLRSCLSGEINSSLLELQYLNHLDLSLKCFGGISIPKFIGSFNKLRYLNLAVAGFAGKVPSELGNLSSLHYLDLCNIPSHVYIKFSNELHVDSLDWLSHLSSLQHLDLGGLNLSIANDWLFSINMLPSLQKLVLYNCSLASIPFPPSLAYVNFSMLSYLDLSENMLGPAIPTWLFNLSKIEDLDLGSNNFKYSIATPLGNLCNLRTISLGGNSFGGDISRFKEGFSGCLNRSLEDLDLRSNGLSGYLPDWLWQFTNLSSLFLYDNSLSGPIPETLASMSSLSTLGLSGNRLNGSIPESLGKLSNLQELDLAGNSFEGVLSDAHFFNSKSLTYLYLSSNSLTLNVSSNWVPPFQLQTLHMNGCKLGPKFPSWLQTQKELGELSLSNTNISESIPDFFWNFSSNIYWIDLSNNSISGSITESIGETTTNLFCLSLSSNRLKGNIPLSICKIPLIQLDLSHNQLTNEIPSCIGDLQYLTTLFLRNNSLFGDIPTSIGHLSWLQSLHLGLNKLSGELPPSLKNCTKLATLDLEKNGFIGQIPTWIGERMSRLMFLNMRSNKFEGTIPQQLSLLSKLQVLDLADNNLLGTIPPSFGNFSAMAVTKKKREYVLAGIFVSYLESIWVFFKGDYYEYKSTISLLMSIDLSSNNLFGEIPEDITHLFGLVNLNLSKNHFTGSIPKKIGQLRQMESLDLACNQFTGVIPPSLSDLTFLSHLNLSHNNLSGRIPSGNQLSTLNDSSIYMGNPLLCGPPLSNHCPGDETPQDQQPQVIGDGEDKNWSEMQLFYLSMGIGFVMGFGIVWGILVFKRSWRIAYFRFFDDMREIICGNCNQKVASFKNLDVD